VVDVLSLLSAIGGIGGFATILYVVYWLGRKFAEIDSRFREIEMRFQQIDEKFKHIDERFKEIDKRFEGIDRRFEGVDRRFESLEKRIENIERRIEGLENRVVVLESTVRRIALAFHSYQEFLLDLLTGEGVLKRESAELAKAESQRILKLALANPFTKEEWERLKRYLEKDIDEFTMEEAEDFLELARKAVMDYGIGEGVVEAFKLHIYATIVRSMTYRRILREKEKQKSEQLQQTK